ncbi:MAG: alpha-N-arabinofuranosidase [Clostridia bacterium]|nr:alpha-N-arabinofuranosidase [Clostridia bacterium]
MIVICSKKQTVGKADKMLFGHFLEHFHRQIYGGVFEPGSPLSDEDGFRTDVLEALRRIRTPIIRWPGGCYVSAYDWKCGVGDPRVPTYDKAWRVEESHKFGTDEFIKLCRKIGCKPYICTNAGTGSAEDMSDWVEYCNLKTMGRWAKKRMENGFSEPHNVRYWSIGNENWGSHEIGAKDAEEWGRLVRESAKMMLRVDPTIELSAASIPDLDWNLNLLRTAGQFLDLISIHGYWGNTENGVIPDSYDTVMLHTGEDISGSIDRVRAYLTALGLEKQIKIAYDEWNLRGWYHPNLMDIRDRARLSREDENFYMDSVIGERDKNDINSIYTMADAVFSASFLNTCMRNCDIVKMACFSPVVNTRGAIFTYPEGIVLRPQFFVFEMYANLLKDTVLNIWQEDIPTITGRVWDDDKTVSTVDTVVTTDGKGYAVAAVNKDPGSGQLITLRFTEDAPRLMRVHTLNGPSADSYNDIGRTDVSVATSEYIPFEGSVTLLPHSVNVIELTS